MATLKEFEDALRTRGMTVALGILDDLRQRDRSVRRAAPARRGTGRKMTPEVARQILDLHGATQMTQQEIAFKIGVNQGRVNEVIKRGKWLDGNPSSPEAQSRDKALAKARRTPRQQFAMTKRPLETKRVVETSPRPAPSPATPPRGIEREQLSFGGL